MKVGDTERPARPIGLDARRAVSESARVSSGIDIGRIDATEQWSSNDRATGEPEHLASATNHKPDCLAVIGGSHSVGESVARGLIHFGRLRLVHVVLRTRSQVSYDFPKFLVSNQDRNRFWSLTYGKSIAREYSDHVAGAVEHGAEGARGDDLVGLLPMPGSAQANDDGTLNIWHVGRTANRAGQPLTLLLCIFPVLGVCVEKSGSNSFTFFLCGMLRSKGSKEAVARGW
jgi:hypothetical protein